VKWLPTRQKLFICQHSLKKRCFEQVLVSCSSVFSKISWSSIVLWYVYRFTCLLSSTVSISRFPFIGGGRRFQRLPYPLFWSFFRIRWPAKVLRDLCRSICLLSWPFQPVVSHLHWLTARKMINMWFWDLSMSTKDSLSRLSPSSHQNGGYFALIISSVNGYHFEWYCLSLWRSS